MIKAQIIADSINLDGNRLTTMVVTFPRFILAELNTHRMLSKNSASSRAIPFNKMVKSVQDNPFIPIAWQKEHKGMQGSEYFTSEDGNNIHALTEGWLNARNTAVQIATGLNNKGVTKQLCNRLLEPFMWHTVIITSSEWENFFNLRCPQYVIEGLNGNKSFKSKKDALIQIQKVLGESDFNNTKDYLHWASFNKGQAEIHIMALAEAMWDAMNESKPKELQDDEWHIPFNNNLSEIDILDIVNDNGKFDNDLDFQDKLILDTKIKISTAMCARISYTVVGEEDKVLNYENDIKLHDRLIQSGHWSPFEHCAKAMNQKDYNSTPDGLGWSGNFRGFVQYRKMLENEKMR